MKHFPHLSKSTMASSFSVHFLALLVFTVFSIVNTQAQTETMAAEFNFDAWVVETENGTIIAIGDDYTGPDAIIKVQLPDGTIVNKNFLHTVQSGADSNSTQFTTSLHNGSIAEFNNYFFVRGVTSKNVGANIWWETLRKYDYSSSPDPLIEKTVKQGNFNVFNVSGEIIIILYKLPGYDQMATDWDLSSVPDNTYCMFIIDEYGNKGSNPVYQLPGEPEIVYKDVLQPTPSGNVAVQMHDGDLIEVNLNTGNFVRTIVDGMQAANHNVLTTNDNTGEEEVIQGGLDANYDLITQVYDENGMPTYKTDLPIANYNNFGYQWDSAKKINGVWYMTRGAGYFTLDSTMIHQEIHVLTASYDYAKLGYANDDGSYTFVVRIGPEGNGAITRVYHVVPPTPQVPQFNQSVNDSNIVAFYDGQVYNHQTNTWENSNYESTLVVNNLPALGYNANNDWVSVPSGYTLVGYFEIQDVVRNGQAQRVCDVQFRKNGYSEKIQMRIRFELESNVNMHDATPPVLNVNSPTYLYVDASGNATLSTSQVDNGSYDNVGITSFSLSQTDFSCSDVGNNNLYVTFSASDAVGNSSSTSVQVIVLDDIDPTAVGQNLQLDLAGATSVSLTPADVNNGSTDNCGITSMSVSQDTFSATGTYNIDFTVTDTSGNSDTTTVNIEVINTVGIDDAQMDKLLLYPNPVRETLYIKADKKVLQAELSDLSGRIIFNQKEPESLDLSGLPTGIYLVKIYTPSGTRLMKVVKR